MAVQSGTYKGVSAADRAADRRRRLLDAALSVWADPDQRTTMTAVCRAAGLTERYFYESFGGLDEVLSAVVEEVGTEIESTTLAAADAAGADPAARITAAVAAFVDLLVADPRKGRVAIIEAAALPGLRARRTQLLRHFAHLAAEEAQHHAARRHEDELAGLLFIGGMAEVVTAWLDGALDVAPEEVVATASRAYLGLYPT
ncbi:AcrR family transcriptional regulator [Nocardioides aromaticivorans]|uniref:AcrR family transcriptional regulator n=1 Tax=Nocardioides aromaticivorans TaxID=200618 RepID=A0A7Z0CMC6_9ACTN|nr:TetR/AcrR family transcriptional regulator [Nocardioides aromaticivorans]NYI43742.1 AcrR family transcriptional regulator [Nocardioides aromaticivorans]